MLVFVAMAPAALADGIQIKRGATVEGNEIHLRDIAELSGDDATAQASLVIGSLNANTSELNITAEEVRKALTAKGINWARVSLRGFVSCHITRKNAVESGERVERVAPRPPSEPVKAAPSKAIIANPVEEVNSSSLETLRGRLMTWLGQVTGASASDFRIECSTRDAETLDAPMQLGKVAFTASAPQMLGRVPVLIEQYEGGKMAKATRVTLTIGRRRLVVVATKAVSRGDQISPGDVEIREVYMDRAGKEPATRLDRVIGQEASENIREGQIIDEDQVESPVFVKRYQMVKMRVVTNTIALTLDGRALEDGTRDQIIKVRNERSKDKEVLLCKVVAAGLVIVAGEDQQPASLHADEAAKAVTPSTRK